MEFDQPSHSEFVDTIKMVNELSENTSITEGTKTPDTIKTQLKPHQLTILSEARKLETEKYKVIGNHKVSCNIGVLCDKVGSGKSLEMLSIIASNPLVNKQLDCIKSFSDTIMCQMIDVPQSHIIPCNIIVVSHSIIKQWIDYIKKHTTLSYFVVMTRKTLQEDIEKNLTTILNSHTILLISSTRYREFYDIYYSVMINNREPNSISKVSRFIVDEADSLKITCFEGIPASFEWYISSTYINLQYPFGKSQYYDFNRFIQTSDPNQWTHRRINRETSTYNIPYSIAGVNCRGHIRELFNKINCNEQVCNAIFLKNKDDYVDYSFRLLTPELVNIMCKNPIVYNILSNIVDNNIISLINAGNTEEAIASINCKKTNEKNIIKAVTETLEEKINNKKIQYSMKSQMTYRSQQAKQDALEKIQKDIDELERNKALIIERVTTSNNVCAICFDTIQNKTIVNCCQTMYCFECLSTWMVNNTSCPHCRTPVNHNNLVIVSDTTLNTTQEEKTSDLMYKDEMLKQIILKRKEETQSKSEPFKILIFSEHECVFDTFTDFLELNDIKSSHLKGSSATITKNIRLFKSLEDDDKLDCLLLNTRFFGSGLNLENTTDMFIYHSMSNEMTHQIIGRAQRPGRTNRLKIWNLHNENEKTLTL
jgi:hypothetical protein